MVWSLLNILWVKLWTVQAATEMANAQEEYIRSMAGSPWAADELAKLASLRDSGALTGDEFAAQKAKLLGLQPRT